MFSVHFTEAAKFDSKEAYKWYEEIHEGLGDRFRKELTKTTAYLRKDPKSIQVRYGDVRVIYLKVFPYGIHFKLSANQVHVIAVLHTSRKPRG